MIEIIAVVATVVTAIVGSMSSLLSRLHRRVDQLDKRLDGVEIRVATDYVSKKDLTAIVTRVESHMIRIEEKLDLIVINGKNK